MIWVSIGIVLVFARFLLHSERPHFYWFVAELKASIYALLLDALLCFSFEGTSFVLLLLATMEVVVSIFFGLLFDSELMCFVEASLPLAQLST